MIEVLCNHQTRFEASTTFLLHSAPLVPPGTPDIDYSSVEMLQAGSSFQPTCNVSGNPIPNVVWTWVEDGSTITGTETKGKYKIPLTGFMLFRRADPRCLRP